MKIRYGSSLLAAAAIAGLTAGTARVSAQQARSGISAVGAVAQHIVNDQNSCKGKNSCKGQGGCESGDNGCRGKNSCKGKGGCNTKGTGGTQFA